MGKYANLFSGIFVFSMGYFLDSMYTSVINSLGNPELIIPLEQIVYYVRFLFLGLGGLLMALGMIGIAVSLIKQGLSEKEKKKEDRKRRYREEEYSERRPSEENPRYRERKRKEPIEEKRYRDE